MSDKATQTEQNELLLRAIDTAEENSYGSDNDSDLQTERAAAIDHYQGKNLEPAPEGRSQVVDRTVFETIQWILPSLCRIYANGGNVVEFTPLGPDDVDGAEQEGDHLNYLVTQKTKWFDLILEWFQDALLTKNAYCMAFIEEKLNTETETYKGQSEESLALLLQGDGVEVVEHRAFPDENDPNPQPALDEQGKLVLDEQGQPILQPRTLFDVTIKHSKPSNKLQFKVLPPERVKVSDSTPSYTLKDCPYFEYFDWITISDLRAQGFDIEDDIASDEEVDSEEDNARDDFINSQADDPFDPAMREVKVRTVWIKHDFDEDGIAELQKVIIVGKEILLREEASRIPVACIVPAINTHRHMGMSVADMVLDLQRICTAILRQGLDNLYQSNNIRTAINTSQVNLDDLLVNRPGGVIRVDGIPAENIMTLPVPFIFPQALEALEYMDSVKEKRSGVSRISQGIDEGALNQHNRIGQLSTMAAQRIEQIARIFASGIEYLFSVSHELVIKHGYKSETLRLRGKWVDVDPSTWKSGRDMRIVVGFGAGNKDTLVARLMTILNIQQTAITSGATFVTEQNIFETVTELTKASDFTAPERFWTDPSTVEPPPPPPDHTMIALEIEKEKVGSDERKKQAEIEQKQEESELEAQVAMARANLDAQVKLIIEKIRAGEKVNLEQVKVSLQNDPIERETESILQTKSAVDSLKEQLVGAVRELKEAASAEKEVVRDKRGRVTGIKTNGKLKKVKRDKDGKVIGL